jgi:hypothetical protein
MRYFPAEMMRLQGLHGDVLEKPSLPVTQAQRIVFLMGVSLECPQKGRLRPARFPSQTNNHAASR